MGQKRTPATPAQRRRLGEELVEVGLDLRDRPELWEALLDEVDYARRPSVHERRVPAFGSVLWPSGSQGEWEKQTGLRMDRRPIESRSVEGARWFADGLSSWLVRYPGGGAEWAVFDRPAGSERDLVVLAEAFGAVLTQRHPSGGIRIVGPFGVFRWDGMSWHHELPVSSWIDALGTCARRGDGDVVETLLEFAVHDLGARNIGATLVYRHDPHSAGSYLARLPKPPALNITTPTDLAPLRHVLAQVDGATLFLEDGSLAEIGVRLVPSTEAEDRGLAFKGMRHTSARHYSFDDPGALVIVVSEDGPVTVMAAGKVLGVSAPTGPDDETD